MTSQEITFEAMNSYFLMANNKINESYLNHLLDITVHHTRYICESMYSRRRKSAAIVWQALEEHANENIKSLELGNYRATSAQLKKWLNTYGRGYESIAETVKDVEQYRQEEIFSNGD